MPNETVRLFDRWKAHKAKEMGLRSISDYEAARLLGISRNAVSQWRNRPSQAGAHLIVRMCADLGEDLSACLLRVASDSKAA
jgi:predicted transcriptional regulator